MRETYKSFWKEKPCEYKGCSNQAPADGLGIVLCDEHIAKFAKLIEHGEIEVSKFIDWVETNCPDKKPPYVLTNYVKMKLSLFQLLDG